MRVCAPQAPGPVALRHAGDHRTQQGWRACQRLRRGCRAAGARRGALQCRPRSTHSTLPRRAPTAALEALQSFPRAHSRFQIAQGWRRQHRRGWAWRRWRRHASPPSAPAAAAAAWAAADEVRCGFVL